MRQHEQQPAPTRKRRLAHFIGLLAAVAFLAGCEGATEPEVGTGAAIYMEAVTSRSVTGTVADEITPAPAVRVTDQHHNPVRGVDVVFWATAENGIPANTTARTDAGGVATVASWRLHTRSGVQTLRAVMARGSARPGEVLFIADANPAAAAIVSALDTTHAALPGSSVTLQVKVSDAYGNVIPGTPVSFEIESGGGSLNRTSMLTDFKGIAKALWKVGPDGGNTATASVSGLNAVRFSATVLQAPLYFDLQSSVAAGWTLPLPSWIMLDVDGRFTASTGGVVGGGQYSVSGPAITFTYSDDFLARVGKSFDWWGYGGGPRTETASFGSDLLVIRRCATEDCYEADWTYRRRTP